MVTYSQRVHNILHCSRQNVKGIRCEQPDNQKVLLARGSMSKFFIFIFN